MWLLFGAVLWIAAALAVMALLYAYGERERSGRAAERPAGIGVDSPDEG